MSANLIEKARTNRLIALEVLKQRDSNLVILGNARKDATRRERKFLFTSCRTAASQELVA